MKQEIKKQEQVKTIELQALKLNRIKVKIIGKTPLIMARQSDEVKKAILEKQTGKSMSNKKMIRDVKKEVEDAIHRLPNGKIGFPANGIKAGMIEATSFVGDKDFSKKLIRGVNIVNTNNGLIPIDYEKQDILQHNPKGAVTVFSPQFHGWSAIIELEYDANNVSDKDLIVLLNYAGHYYGLGSWSPRCKSGGSYGTYEVARK